jgi:hypothetical protein
MQSGLPNRGGSFGEELDHFYEEAESEANLKVISRALLKNYAFLKEGIACLEEEELLRETTSFFVAVHSRFEWILDTLAHLYHHRGQLHAMIVHVLKRETNIQLFE